MILFNKTLKIVNSVFQKNYWSNIFKINIRRCTGLHYKAPYLVPDYKVFNSIENCPKLIQLRDALAAKGLCDPWIRNEVWRFDTRNFGTQRKRFLKLFRGIEYGLVLAIISTIFTKYTKRSEDSHENYDESSSVRDEGKIDDPKYFIPGDDHNECPKPK